MDLQNEKCVMMIDPELPLGMIANTAAIMGITIGKYMPEVVGQDVTDKSGNSHLGIIEFPVPVLKVSRKQLGELRKRLYEPEFSELVCVDFSDVAQECKVYEEYIEKAAKAGAEEFVYYGLCICGRKKLVNKLTGNLPLLR